MPLVSVIMTSYNHEGYISEAIESVLSQTFEDIELIIIDDASKDNSQQIIAELSKNDPRIKYIFHEENKGIAKTLNDGLEKSAGKYIAPIASDDVWEREKLDKQIEILNKDENLVVWCSSAIIDKNSNPTGEISSEKYKNSTANGYVFEEIVNSWIAGSCIIFKKDNINGIQFDENLKYLNDTQFLLDLAYRYKFYYIEEPLSKYRLHGDNSSFGKIKDIDGWYQDSLSLCTYVFQEYSNKLSNKAIKNIFYKTCVVPFIIGTHNDLINRLNIIYPVKITLNFVGLTIKNLPKIIRN